MAIVYFQINFDTQEEASEVAERVHNLLSQTVNRITAEPPKLVISSEDYQEDRYLIFPEVLLVEKESDFQGKIVREGTILCEGKRFKLEIF